MPINRQDISVSFFILVVGDGMKIYVDLVFLLNVAFDFLLLLTTSIILHRHTHMKRLILGALFGGVSIFFLFIQMSSLWLFFMKLMVSVGMILIVFGYRNRQYFIKNIGYLYMVSIVMGGFLYFLNVQFSYQQEGIVFYHKGLSINVIFLIIFTPIILYTYIKLDRERKELYSHIYQVSFSYQDKEYQFQGFVDTGNQLKDPYRNRPVMLVEEKKLNLVDPHYIYIPYHTVNHQDLLRCISVKEVTIQGVGQVKNVLVGLLSLEVVMDGVDCILQERIVEGNNDTKNTAVFKKLF